MLHELRVENLLLIERAELRLGPGLNVLTGETGAGKTMLAHALDLLLGGKARSGIVRPGTAEAYVEGVFELDPRVRELVGERLPEDAEELVLARRVWADGRTRAYLNGRSATVADLRDVGGELLAFYGQHEHRRLTLASAQLEVLDGVCGPEQRARREAYAAAWAASREARRRLEELAERAGGRERELDLLRYELAEIEEADPSEAEAAELTAERDRLRHLEALRGAALAGAEAMAPESGGPGVGFLLAEAGRHLDAAAGVDPALDVLAERWRSLALEADDVAGELRRYEDGLEAAPGRLEEVEERLGVLGRLERKHGGSLAAVLAHADECRRRIAELAGMEEATEEAEARRAEAEARLAALAAELTAARRAAAPALAEGVRERLAELAMEGASFAIDVSAAAEPGPTGADRVEFLVAPNPGVAAGPLGDIASGGETSRIMLALLSVAHAGGEAADDRLLVFDEIDAGIGGVTARAVGAQLRALAEGRQVLCITHLPQVASAADRHFRIAKDTGREPARTTVADLDGEAVVGELVRMLGADDDDHAAREHARTLLAA
ncbi:MAG TPA: DNA repair protein RecN [Solirubrobacteraceae bacterium]